MVKILCAYCEQSYSKSYFNNHQKTKKHLNNFVANEMKEYAKINCELIGVYTKKYSYDLDFMIDMVKEKYLVKNIKRMAVEMDICKLKKQLLRLRIAEELFRKINYFNLNKYRNNNRFRIEYERLTPILKRNSIEMIFVNELIIELKIKYFDYKRADELERLRGRILTKKLNIYKKLTNENSDFKINIEYCLKKYM